MKLSLIGKKCVVCGKKVERKGRLLCEVDRWIWELSVERAALQAAALPPGPAFRQFISRAKTVRASRDAGLFTGSAAVWHK